MLGRNRTYVVSKRSLSVLLVTSLLLALAVLVVSPGPVLADWTYYFECRIEPCGGVSDRAYYMKVCGSNCSPPCGPWILQTCGCPG